MAHYGHCQKLQIKENLDIIDIITPRIWRKKKKSQLS